MARFEPLKFGLGNFIFTPKAGDRYKAIILIGDSVLRKELPQAIKQGYVLYIKNESESKIRAIVRTNLPSGNPVHLFIHTRQSPRHAEAKIIVNGMAEFIIDKNRLGDGISHLTIFNNAK